MFTSRVLCSKLANPTEYKLVSVQCACITSRTHVKDYRPRPNSKLPKRPFIPPRKKDAYLTHATPVIDPFQTSFQPIKEFEPIQEFYDDEQHEHILPPDNDGEETHEDEQFRNIWPYKKWLWRSDKNFEGRTFDPKQTLDYFIEDENTNVGRHWYITELRYKSNEDLWRLWYVLLREKNMLNSMRFACRAAKRQMPNFGRLSKVRKSMARIKCVWAERANLKLANLEQEQKRKQEKARNDAIEYRRTKLLEKREKIKAMFFQYVDKLSKEGEDVERLFPKFDNKRRRPNTKRHYIIDEPMKPKPALTTSQATMIPSDLLLIIQSGMSRA